MGIEFIECLLRGQPSVRAAPINSIRMFYGECESSAKVTS